MFVAYGLISRRLLARRPRPATDRGSAEASRSPSQGQLAPVQTMPCALQSEICNLEISSLALLPKNLAVQLLPRVVGCHEQIIWHLRHVPEHVGVDHIGLIQVQPEPRQVLQP